MPESSRKSNLRSILVKYAARVLSARPYFRSTLKDKLFRKAESLELEASSEVIESILEDLAQSGYLDDQYLAQAYVRRQLGKGYGPKVIAVKLKYLGLEPQMVTSALKSDATEEAELASIRHYCAKFPRLDRRKLIQKLYFRGYLGLSIKKVLQYNY